MRHRGHRRAAQEAGSYCARRTASTVRRARVRLLIDDLDLIGAIQGEAIQEHAATLAKHVYEQGLVLRVAIDKADDLKGLGVDPVEQFRFEHGYASGHHPLHFAARDQLAALLAELKFFKVAAYAFTPQPLL